MKKLKSLRSIFLFWINQPKNIAVVYIKSMAMEINCKVINDCWLETGNELDLLIRGVDLDSNTINVAAMMF